MNRGVIGACAHRVPEPRGELGDFARFVPLAPYTLALLANAYDSGFSVRWPAGSRKLLDYAAEAWTESDGEPGGRLVDAFDSAGIRFIDDACDYLQGHPDDFDAPSASMMLALVDEDVAHLAWVGETCAVHVRDGAVIERFEPTTLARAKPDIVFPGEVGSTLARLIQKGDHWVTNEARLVLRPGDRVAMSTRPRAYGEWYGDAASVLASCAELDRAAEALVSERFASKHGFVAACVLGFD